MAAFETPADLTYNRGLVNDPAGFAEERGAAAWLFMCGDEFAAVEGGMSFASVEEAVPDAVQLPADPPNEFNMDVARRGVEALDKLSRPALVTCRMGPRSSALVYLYAGLKANASAEEVLAKADADEAPFAGNEQLRAWVTKGLADLEVGGQDRAGV